MYIYIYICSPNQRSLRGPGGVGRGLDSVSRARKWPLRSLVDSRGLPWSPVVSRGLPWSPVVSRGLPWSPVVCYATMIITDHNHPTTKTQVDPRETRDRRESVDDQVVLFIVLFIDHAAVPPPFSVAFLRAGENRAYRNTHARAHTHTHNTPRHSPDTGNPATSHQPAATNKIEARPDYTRRYHD